MLINDSIKLGHMLFYLNCVITVLAIISRMMTQISSAVWFAEFSLLGNCFQVLGSLRLIL